MDNEDPSDEPWYDESMYGDPNEVSPRRVAGALAGAAIGGVAGALLWAFVVASARLEIGIIALVLGALAGAGASFGSGRARGLPYQIIAAACTLASYALAKLLIVVFLADAPLSSLLSPVFISEIGLAAIIEGSSAFDLLWIALAVGVAWKIPSNSL